MLSADRASKAILEANARLDALRKARGVGLVSAENRPLTQRPATDRPRGQRPERPYKLGAETSSPSKRSFSAENGRGPVQADHQSGWFDGLRSRLPSSESADSTSPQSEKIEDSGAAVAGDRQKVEFSAENSIPILDPVCGEGGFSAEGSTTILPVCGSGGLSAEIDDIEVNVSLLLAMTAARKVLAGRVWLLLWQLVNKQHGQQHIADSEVRQLLCNAESRYKLFGDRQWRKVRSRGNGAFWDVLDDGQLFIYGRKRVVKTLKIERFGKQFVEVNPLQLLKKVSKVSALFLELFHAAHGSNPISRAAIQEATGIHERTQRNYEQERRITPRRNIKILAPKNSAAAENAVYEHRFATFVLTDHQGKQGAVGDQYIACTLPNSYPSNEISTAKRSKQRRINTSANPLAMGQGAITQRYERRYFENGKAAAKCLNRYRDTPVHLLTPIGVSCGVYHVL